MRNLFFALLVCLLNHNAYGDWVEIQQLRNKDVTVEYFAESLVANPTGGLVSWRFWRLPKGEYYEQTESEVNCDDFSLRHIRTCKVDPDFRTAV